MLLGAGFPGVGREGGSRSPFGGFLSGGVPEWGHLANLGLGFGCSGPFGSPVGLFGALFPGSTTVLEGIL